MVTFLGHILTHRQWLRIIHCAREPDERGDKELVTFLEQILLWYMSTHGTKKRQPRDRDESWSHFLGQILAHMQLFRMTHTAHDMR